MAEKGTGTPGSKSKSQPLLGAGAQPYKLLLSSGVQIDVFPVETAQSMVAKPAKGAIKYAPGAFEMRPIDLNSPNPIQAMLMVELPQHAATPHMIALDAAMKDAFSKVPGTLRELGMNVETKQAPAAETRPQWKANTADYLDLVAVSFKKHRELTDSFAVFYDKTSNLFGAPFRSVGDNTIFIPSEAKKLFAAYVKKQGYAASFSDVVHGLERPRVSGSTLTL